MEKEEIQEKLIVALAEVYRLYNDGLCGGALMVICDELQKTFELSSEPSLWLSVALYCGD